MGICRSLRLTTFRSSVTIVKLTRDLRSSMNLETKKPLEISSNGFGVSCEMCGPCFSTRQYIRGRTKNEGRERFNL